MTKLRITVGALRRLVGGMTNLFEADETDEERKAAQADRMAARRRDRLYKIMKTRDAEREKAIGPEHRPDRSDALRDRPINWSQGPTVHKVTKKDDTALTGAALKPADYAGSGKTRSTGVKNPAGYDPQLPRQPAKSLQWLSVADKDAYEGLLKMGQPRGQIYSDKSHIRFRPDDPTKPALFWAGVPEKKKIEKDEFGNVQIKQVSGGERKGHNWRPYEELDQDQRRSIGWMDPKDRGATLRNRESYEAKKARLAAEKAAAQGLDVRVRGYSASMPQSFAYDDEGNLAPAEAEVTGHVPGTATAAASAAAQRGFAAKHSRLPNWEMLSAQDLRQWRDAATTKYKSSRDSADLKIVQDIDNVISRRKEGMSQQVIKRPIVAPEKARVSPAEPATRFVQTPEERWGKRKSWGDASKSIEVDKIVRPKTEPKK